MKFTHTPFNSFVALLLFLCINGANADFTNSDEKLRDLYELDGYFITLSSDDFFFNGESCKRNLQNRGGIHGFQKFRPGFTEIIVVTGPKNRFYRPPEISRAPTRYSVISTDPLVFDVEIDTKGAFLVERYTYMKDYKILKRLKGIECRNCVGGQKYAFDSVKDETREINFCTGRP